LTRKNSESLASVNTDFLRVAQHFPKSKYSDGTPWLRHGSVAALLLLGVATVEVLSVDVMGDVSFAARRSALVL
jgi:hypothetical protein